MRGNESIKYKDKLVNQEVESRLIMLNKPWGLFAHKDEKNRLVISDIVKSAPIGHGFMLVD